MVQPGEVRHGLTSVPRVGDHIAEKYQVEGALGAGGMGVVLAARHLDLGTHVAIKVLPESLAFDPESRARFMREARAAAALQTDHAIRVLDVGTLETGSPFIVMERLYGSGLDKIIARTKAPFPIEEATDYVLQACEAMTEAHARGIIHRDLKPANLFVADRPGGGRILKVLDFGLAKLRDGVDGGAAASFTSTGMIAGTPHYAAPEQLNGLRHADARADVWSLGVIAYELFTLVRPFQADGILAVLARVAVDEPAPPRSIRDDLPEEIDEIVLRCLRKDPSERVQSVEELARALRPHLRAASSVGSLRGEESAAHRPSSDSSAAHRDGPSAAQVTAAMDHPPSSPEERAVAPTIQMTVRALEPGPPDSTTLRLDRLARSGATGSTSRRVLLLSAVALGVAVTVTIGVLATLRSSGAPEAPGPGSSASLLPAPRAPAAIASDYPSDVPSTLGATSGANDVEPAGEPSARTATPATSTSAGKTEVGRPSSRDGNPPGSVLKKWP